MFFIKTKLNRNYGFSLVEMIVALGVSMIFLYGTTTILVNQQRELQKLKIKASLIDFQNELRLSLKAPSACEFNFKNTTFNPSTPGESLTSNYSGALYLGENSSAIKIEKDKVHPQISGLFVKDIKIKNLRLPSATANPDYWLGDLTVDFNIGSVALRPVTSLVSLTTVTVGSEKMVDHCATALIDEPLTAVTCAAGSAITSITALGEATCTVISGTPQPPQPPQPTPQTTWQWKQINCNPGITDDSDGPISSAPACSSSLTDKSWIYSQSYVCLSGGGCYDPACGGQFVQKGETIKYYQAWQCGNY